jgi:aminomethyltransferase
MSNVSDETSLIAIQGPKATETLQKLTETNYLTFLTIISL